LISHRSDGGCILEFADRVLARARLAPHPTEHHRSVVDPDSLAYPLDAWPQGALHLVSVQHDGIPYRFAEAHEPGGAPDSLDLATLDEALAAAQKAGGLGSAPAVSGGDATKALSVLRELVKHFERRGWQARAARLRCFLDRAQHAAEERRRWDDFLLHHPVFHDALAAQVARLRTELRPEVRQEILVHEAELKRRIEEAERDAKEWTELARHVKDEAEQTHPPSLASPVASAKPGGAEAPPDGNGSLAAGMDLAPSGGVALAVSEPLPVTMDAVPLATPDEALGHLEKNFKAAGIAPLSARLLAREVLAAACVGQLVFLRGSFAETVTDAVACSLGGHRVVRLPVPVGASDEIALPAGEAGVVVLEGANRACVSSYGRSVRTLIQRRALGREEARSPVLLATLLEGPGTLNFGTELAALGPVFDTDCLTWDTKGSTGAPGPGRCEPSAWTLTAGKDEEFDADALIEGVLPAGNALWERQAAAALSLLIPLSSDTRPRQHVASFLFGWVVPRLVATGGDLAQHADRLEEALGQEGLSLDQRLVRQLRGLGWGANQ
jgi:hypothetical protein